MRVERVRVAILFGGRSAEHEVSVVSAQGVLAAIDRDAFEPIPVGITRSGAWLTPEETAAALARIGPGHYAALPDVEDEGVLARTSALAVLRRVDVAFPLVHGTHGEDGTLQGLLELADVPYVGAGVAASALGMDKALQKALLRQASLPVPDWLTVSWHRWRQDAQAVEREAGETIGYPCFVKPANGGSSIGTAKVAAPTELAPAMAAAFRYDGKVLIEKAIAGREIECSVLGNHEPVASPLGEVVPTRAFYDYDAKYMDPTTSLIVPTPVPAAAERRIRDLAVAAFRAIDGAGMARVDFFLAHDGQVYINEINTIPGFTPISMYPKLWEVAGLCYRDLITRLIELALERWREERRG
ncbi:MAG: D-alanine--D-alanine ligase family protein [Dehalococcoidia bacterium]